MSDKKIISLFSGAGGMDIGFNQAGFETAVMVEFDSSCCKTLRHNCPQIPVIEGDIRQISTEQILKAGNLSILEPALVIGGPPCQSFSLAGKRMGMDDPRGQLVLEFVRVVRESLPVAFVMENVRGMLNWEGGKAIEAIKQEFLAPIDYQGQLFSYRIEVKVLNAANFGAPQFRERVFLVGNRIGKSFTFPVPTHSASPELFGTKPFATVWDAIGKLPPADEPSEVAKRISSTIKDRIIKHGY